MRTRMLFVGLLLLLAGSGSALADGQRPDPVTGVQVSALSANSARVTWNAPWDNVGVTGYNVFRDYQYVASVHGTNYVDNSAVPGKQHEYAIVAYDASNNFSCITPYVAVNMPQNQSPVVAQAQPSNNNAQQANIAASSDGRPVGLRIDILNQNQVRLYWNPVNGATGYNVFQDGVYLGSTTALQRDSNWMNPGQNYRFNVQAYFSWGHSPLSSNLMVNTRMPNGLVPMAPTSNQAANGTAPAGWRMVFSEEFNGSSLDTSKWNTSYLWGNNQTINGEEQHYVDIINDPGFGYNPFQFDGQHLNITAIRTPEHLRGKANWKPYLSGMINTRGKFNMLYGYIEMRAKMPRGKGFWPAFWALHSSVWGVKPEIDIVEFLGQNPTQWFHAYHYHHDGWNLQSNTSDAHHGPDLTADYHLYAVKWQPGSIIYYVDGVERYRHESWNVSWENMYLLLNLAVGGWWPGSPDGSTPFPSSYSIDWVRAWQG